MELAEIFVAVVRDGHPALVRVNGAEWEILRGRLTFREHVEEGGFSAGGGGGGKQAEGLNGQTLPGAQFGRRSELLIDCSTHPTLGSPTMPIFREVPNRPMIGACLGAAAFFGAIWKLV